MLAAHALALAASAAFAATDCTSTFLRAIEPKICDQTRVAVADSVKADLLRLANDKTVFEEVLKQHACPAAAEAAENEACAPIRAQLEVDAAARRLDEACRKDLKVLHAYCLEYSKTPQEPPPAPKGWCSAAARRHALLQHALSGACAKAPKGFCGIQQTEDSFLLEQMDKRGCPR